MPRWSHLEYVHLNMNLLCSSLHLVEQQVIFHWLYFSHFSLPVVAPDDFASILTTLTFDPCKTRACVDVHIENDCDVEQDEYLIAALGTVLYTERVYVSKIPTKVHIIDDDSKIPKCWGELSYALKSSYRSFCEV